MNTITLPRDKYLMLKQRAAAYDLIVGIMEQEFFSPPPTRSAKKIIGEFRQTGRYNEAFLSSLAQGLARSSYFKK